ncbi:hypothetical protein H8356DRAFT_1340639 [Neocallimastix lanati (nom. inval.)]|nr:hypothetical protein H8356DRAFT_1340639 [Neocallimastix sp. JGI-2020a]
MKEFYLNLSEINLYQSGFDFSHLKFFYSYLSNYITEKVEDNKIYLYSNNRDNKAISLDKLYKIENKNERVRENTDIYLSLTFYRII